MNTKKQMYGYLKLPSAYQSKKYNQMVYRLNKKSPPSKIYRWILPSGKIYHQAYGDMGTRQIITTSWNFTNTASKHAVKVVDAKTGGLLGYFTPK